MSNIKKNILNVIEFVLVVVLLSFICFYINRGIVLKGIYKDDLYDWSWFRGTSFFDFVLKFYESSHYRPVFEAVQYLIYTIVGTNPFKFVQINEIYNIVVATFIYYFVRNLKAGKIISILTGSLYLISHYAYYQIGQAIGSLETTALFLSLVILYLVIIFISDFDSRMEVEGTTNNATSILTLIFLTFFLLVFDHERYLAVVSIIFLAILFSDKFKKFRYRIYAIIVFLIEILVILYIRYLAIGKVLPAGTGGTSVEDTFNVRQFLSFCVNQVAIIFGINIGPEHLFGIDFMSVGDALIKRLTIISIALIFIIFIIYIIVKIRKTIISNKSVFKSLYIDIIFISFIGSLIAASSVTVRVELRFVYTSFIASVIYLAYMCAYMKDVFRPKALVVIPTMLYIAVFLLRSPIELLYRSYYDKIYCYVDMARVNSIYDNTIGCYGLDETLHKKAIYLVNKAYDMTNFYAEYLLKIYDETDVGNPIIVINDISEIDLNNTTDDTIILYENHFTNVYEKLDMKEMH